MFRYRKQLTLALVVVLVLSLAATLFSGVMSTSQDDVETVACEDSQSREIRTLVQNQSFAFRSQNVSGAYAYFSESFRNDIDVERFSLIVGTNYPMLLKGNSIAFGECRVIDIGLAQAVTVTTDDGANKLLYFITQADGTMAVEGITVEGR